VIAFTIGYFSIALIGVGWLEYGASGTSTKKYTKLPKPENHNQQQVNGLLSLRLISDSGNPRKVNSSSQQRGLPPVHQRTPRIKEREKKEAVRG